MIGFLLLAETLLLNPVNANGNNHFPEFVGALDYDKIELTSSQTITGTFSRVTMKLKGEDAIKIHSQNSLLVFRDSELGAAGDWNQYNGTDGNYNKSFIAIDGKFIVKPNGHKITLHRVKSYTDKTAAIIVKGEGKLILDNPQNVTVVRPEDLKGLAIQVKAKKEAK